MTAASVEDVPGRQAALGAVSRRQVLQGTLALMATGVAGGLGACSSSDGANAVSAWIYRPEFRTAIETILDAFGEAHPEVEIDMEYHPFAQYPTLLQTALVGGTAPDAIATQGAVGIWGDLGARNDYIMPLDGKVPLKELLPAVSKVVQFKGHTYAAPVQIFRLGIYYQREIFADHGLEPPSTWTDLRALCDDLKANDMTPWAMAGQDMILPFNFYNLAVNSILGLEGYQQLRAGERTLTEPDLAPAAELMADMVPYFNEGYLSVAYEEAKALFAQGEAAMVIGGSSDYAGYAEINPDLDVGFFGFPSPEGPDVTALSGLSMAYVVNKEAEHPQDAVTFASWLTSEPAQRLVLEHLGLPSRKSVVPEGDDPRSEVLRAILAVPSTPSWVEYPETGGTQAAVNRDGSGIFTGRLSPDQFAELVQDAIDPNAAS